MLFDPIADYCTRIRNGYMVKKDKVEIPYSKIKEEITKILIKENYLKDYKIENPKDKTKKSLLIELKFDEDGNPAITKIERVSKTGLRIYKKAKRLPWVLSGLGMAIISTHEGLLTNTQAKKKNLGGEIICQVW